VAPELQDQIGQIDRLNSRLWPVEAVMERLSVGRSMVFELMAKGQLRSVKVGRRRLVSESAICEYIARIDQADGGAA
jgi:excisionase family DNA binding protein